MFLVKDILIICLKIQNEEFSKGVRFDLRWQTMMALLFSEKVLLKRRRNSAVHVFYLDVSTLSVDHLIKRS